MQQLADKAALPEKRLCYRNRAPVCFHTWGNSGLSSHTQALGISSPGIDEVTRRERVVCRALYRSKFSLAVTCDGCRSRSR